MIVKADASLFVTGPEPKVIDCDPNPCNGQQCNLTESGWYNCTCDPGYDGEHCEIGKIAIYLIQWVETEEVYKEWFGPWDSGATVDLLINGQTQSVEHCEESRKR